MTASSLEERDTAEARFQEALTRLKQRGCAVLVAGEAPEPTYQQAARELHGATDTTRYRIHAITGEEAPSDNDAWLPGDVSPDDDTVEIVDYRSDHRTAATEGGDDIITPMRAGPAYPPLGKNAATVNGQELADDAPSGGAHQLDSDIDWNHAARPVPGLRGKRPRMVKPQGVDLDPSQEELEAVDDLKEGLRSAVADYGTDVTEPGELRLGLSSIAPLVRTLGEQRIQSFVDELRADVIEHNGLMFAQFPHQINSPEGTYLREHFDVTVLVRRSLERSVPHAYLRFVIPQQDGITDQPLLSGWFSYGPNQRDHRFRGR